MKITIQGFIVNLMFITITLYYMRACDQLIK